MKRDHHHAEHVAERILGVRAVNQYKKGAMLRTAMLTLVMVPLAVALFPFIVAGVAFGAGVELWQDRGARKKVYMAKDEQADMVFTGRDVQGWLELAQTQWEAGYVSLTVLSLTQALYLLEGPGTTERRDVSRELRAN